MPVAEMLARMSASELAEWRAFDLVEPIGEPRADLRAGIVAAVLWNANFESKKTPFDFMPYTAGPLAPPRREPEPAVPPEQLTMEAEMKSFFRTRAA
jgi:hypothetical protein